MDSIVVSAQDPAGKNIQRVLLENFSFKETGRKFDGSPVFEFKGFELVEVKEKQVFAGNVNQLNSEIIIFASKHASASGKPTLTVHPIGNYGKAELGGKDSALCPSSALLMRSYLIALKEKRDSLSLDYGVSLEATHHGPFLEKPTVFIELGSSEKQWNDLKAARALAETIVHKTSTEGKARIALGVGGNHYAPAFTSLELEKEIAFSHIIPEYQLQNFSPEILRQMVQKTVEKVELIAVDWKGLGKEKQRVLQVLEKQGIPFERTKNIRKVM